MTDIALVHMNTHNFIHTHTHTMQTQVIWKKQFKASSSDHGTFYHFCSLLGRLPKAKDPKKDMNACTDVLFTVLKGHYVACACSLLGIASPNDTPKHLPPLKTREQKSKFIAELSRKVINLCSINKEALLNKPVAQTNDCAYNYAQVFCHLASLALELKDSCSETDGDRVECSGRSFSISILLGEPNMLGRPYECSFS